MDLSMLWVSTLRLFDAVARGYVAVTPVSSSKSRCFLNIPEFFGNQVPAASFHWPGAGPPGLIQGAA